MPWPPCSIRTPMRSCWLTFPSSPVTCLRWSLKPNTGLILLFSFLYRRPGVNAATYVLPALAQPMSLKPLLKCLNKGIVYGLYLCLYYSLDQAQPTTVLSVPTCTPSWSITLRKRSWSLSVWPLPVQSSESLVIAVPLKYIVFPSEGGCRSKQPC